ncbi:HIT domain-containing protein [Chlamydiota bacterium]
MEKLWAPWRMKYILDEEKEDCIFCNKAKKENEKREFVLERAKENFVLLNIYPYNNGHLMIAPFRHVPSLDEMTDAELCESILLTKKWVKLVKKVLQPNGFNIGLNLGAVAGAGVKDHVHLHIVPRWQGDTNFMPVISDTKIIPQALDELYDVLKKEVDKEEKG